MIVSRWKHTPIVHQEVQNKKDIVFDLDLYNQENRSVRSTNPPKKSLTLCNYLIKYQCPNFIKLIPKLLEFLLESIMKYNALLLSVSAYGFVFILLENVGNLRSHSFMKWMDLKWLACEVLILQQKWKRLEYLDYFFPMSLIVVVRHLLSVYSIF